MLYKVLNDYNEESHDWEPFIPPRANKLILGTFPTAENNRISYPFFYPNPNNDFWRIIFGIAGKRLEDFAAEDPVGIRKAILTDLKLGIADIGKRVLRQHGSSKDHSLFPLEYADILSLLEENRDIEKIILTSSSGDHSVVAWFHHYLELNGYSFEIKKKLPWQSELVLDQFNIAIEVVASTSRLSPIKGEKLISMYQAAILG